jgi:hypothetical protein
MDSRRAETYVPSTAHRPRLTVTQARGALCLPTAPENPPRTHTGRHRTAADPQGRGARVAGAVRESQQCPGISLLRLCASSSVTLRRRTVPSC